MQIRQARPVSSNIYRPTINSTGPNLKTVFNLLINVFSSRGDNAVDDMTCEVLSAL
jgi:hypothetical protein